MKSNAEMKAMIEVLKKLDTGRMYLNDFFHTWKESDDEIHAVFQVAEILRAMRENNISTKVFDSGLGISVFRDNSTRTRFSFASACNLLGLEVQDLDEKVSQIAHGETVRETANMVSFMADVIGIRDDMYIGKGHTYMKTVADSVEEGYRDGVLEQRPTLVNLQCDIDHPTQSMADMLHVINHFGGVENLKGKKIAMTWAYSPSYGKPLSVPQGIIGLFSRFGMEVVLAHPEGYEIMSDVEEIAAKNAKASGGSYRKVNTMEEAFKDADIVYPKSWAPLRPPAVPTGRSTPWRRRSRMQTSSIRSHGRRSRSWRRGRSSSSREDSTTSRILRRDASRTMPSSRTGPAPRS